MDRRIGLVVCIGLLTTLGLNPTHVRAQELRVFFGNLHSHTDYSDGSGTPEEAYRHARDVARIDFLAITEHNHAQAGDIAKTPSLYNGSTPQSLIQTAKRFTQTGRFVAIYGQEFSTIDSGNHANVFEVQDVIQTSDVPNGSWDTLLNTWIPGHLDSEGKEALILLNHPKTSGSSNTNEYGIDDFPSAEAWRAALDARAELINIINGPSHKASGEPGKPTEDEYRRYLDLGLHIAPTADQDNHLRNWGDAAETRTAIIAPELSKPALLRALRERNVYATQDRNLRLVPTIQGKLIGARTKPPAAGSKIQIEIQIEDDDEPSAEYEIDVFMDEVGGDDDANVVGSFSASGNGVHRFDELTYEGGNRYVFLRVRQLVDDEIGPDTAWTAPVWFEAGAAGGPGGPPPPPVVSLSLAVDLEAEKARISNTGTAAADLSGWQLVSVQGNQTFTLPNPFSLAPGKTLTVVSGSGAKAKPPLVLLWTKSAIWRNSGDPAELRDPSGNVVAQDP